MLNGVTGYLDFEATKGFTLRVHYAETYDIATNKSDSLTITKLQIYSGQRGNTYWHYLDGTISVNGTPVVTMDSSTTTHKAFISVGSWVDCSGTLGSVSDIAHAADGSKNVSITVDVTGYAEAWAPQVESGSGWNVSASKNLALTTIPRASGLSVSNGTLGTAQKLTVTKAADSFNHTITYKCGSATGTVCEHETSAEVNFTPPLNLASQNTVGTSVSVTFTLQTYSGTTAIGDAVNRTVSMAIPASVKPSLALAVSDHMGYADRYGAYVKGLSRLKVTVTPTIAHGAEIISYNVVANGMTYGEADFVTDALKSTGSLSVSATVTDSRNRTSAEVKKTITAINYTSPAITGLTAKRCNSNGTENAQGGYVKVTFSAAVTALNNRNGAEYILNYRKTGAVDWNGVALDELYGDYTVTNYSYVFAADTGSSYEVEVTVEDNHFGSIYKTTAPTAFALMHPNPDGTGMAFGKISEKSDAFEFGRNVYDMFNTLMGNGIAAYTGGGDGGIDPDTTLEGLCLTSHSNAPQGLGTFYYIHTAFYNTKATGAARAQIAFPYKKHGSLYHRYYADGAWSAWTRYMTADEIYPVGSVCIRYDTTSPATLYGGTWTRIEGRFLYGSASTGTIGATGSHTTGSGSSTLPYVNVAIWRRTA